MFFHKIFHFHLGNFSRNFHFPKVKLTLMRSEAIFDKAPLNKVFNRILESFPQHFFLVIFADLWTSFNIKIFVSMMRGAPMIRSFHITFIFFKLKVIHTVTVIAISTMMRIAGALVVIGG
eukprot:13576.XXX_212681_213040_1 [CDS] Oithona nana genome sequencing.